MALAQILVVEDERIVARGIQCELEQMGYDVPELASSGEEALEKAARLQPDLVLMDIVLKGKMDGIEAARQIRERFDIPVIYLSAYEDENTLLRARATEPFGYLLKPYEEKELHTTIEMALHKHRREQRLKQTESWLAATLRSIDDGVLATDSRLCVRFINPVAEKLTGWPQDRALGQHLTEICRLLDEQTSAAVDLPTAQAISAQAGLDLPERVLLASQDGRCTPVEGYLSPIFDPEGCFTGVVVVLRDVSQRRELERSRQQAEEQRQHALKMEAVSRLAGGIAHDFNNLLTVILGNTSLVLSRLDPADPNHDLLAAAETAAFRASQLVEQLLNFSGQHRPALKPMNLNDFLQEMLGVLRRLLDTRIRLDFTPGSDLWPVQADHVLLSDILVNLAQNAQESMHGSGRLSLETENVSLSSDYQRQHPQARPGEFVRLRLQNTGHGIAPESLPTIFEPFFLPQEPGKRFGLGLALVFGAVERHHGWMECSSRGDQGTLFDIYLPRYGQGPVLAPAAPPVPRRQKDRPTILLADDEPLLRELGLTVLEQEGYRVLLAEDGQQAVEIFRQEREPIDLVVLDLTMPRLSGKDALRAIRAIHPQVRVVFSSGYFAEDLTEQEGQIVGFLHKPYRPDQLLNMVKSALARTDEG